MYCNAYVNKFRIKNLVLYIILINYFNLINKGGKIMNEMQKVKPTNRVAEMVLGIMGSIFGILGGLFAIMLQGVSSQLDTDGGNVGGLGVAVIITCIITLILSCIINKKSFNWCAFNHWWNPKLYFY